MEHCDLVSAVFRQGGETSGELTPGSGLVEPQVEAGAAQHHQQAQQTQTDHGPGR